MHNLNPMTMNLDGSSLIEASAGTGKTYTITALYLRYLLGINDTGALGEPLSIDQILVVTFTEAATAEIKDRVRSRLILLRDRLLGDTTKDEIVETIFELLAQQGEEVVLRAFKLLDAAVKSMEDAAIYTIHGFCQRMLKQHAFESGMAFNLQFVMDQSEMISEGVKDFWREYVYSLDETNTRQFLGLFKSPKQLESHIYHLLNKHTATVTPQYTIEQAEQLSETFTQKVLSFKQQCRDSEFIEALERSDIKKNNAAASKKNLAALKAFCLNDELNLEIGKKSFEIWHSSVFSNDKIYKKDGQIFHHPLLNEIDELIDLQQKSKAALPIAIKCACADFVKQYLISEKAKQALINPDDLLLNLHHALYDVQGESLAGSINAQFPVAMIDEFQDTDSIQYGIFSLIYAKDNTSLVMIGDPKQAIYGFRGADIFTYIEAKQAVDENKRFTLSTNYRSSKAVVDSVNAIFMQSNQSFIFSDDIPFVAVDAKGKDSASRYQNDDAPHALNFYVANQFEEYVPKSEGNQVLADITANKIATQLRLGQQHRAMIGETPVQAKDICVLVRDRQEAQLIKHALAERKVSSVFLSRQSVFKTEIAYHVLNFLSALDGEYDESRYRGVLVGPLFGLSYQAVYQTSQDVQLWQGYLTQFAHFTQTWRKQGVMALMELLIAENKLPSLWLKQGLNVERWLTDFRHLAELLQQKQLELEGAKRLLHWLHDHIVDDQGDGAQIRLESDDALVKIITMHGSKGLEYPIVYIPFVLNFRDVSEAIYHKGKTLTYDLAPNEDSLALANKERLAEDIRLLYVAMTRPIHQLNLGLYNIKDGRANRSGIQKTALGYLLFSSCDENNGSEWLNQLTQFVDKHESMLLELCEQTDERIFFDSQTPTENLIVNEFNGDIERNWRLTSFSALTQNSHFHEHTPGADDESHQLDWQQAPLAQFDNVFSFPKGAKPGSCLHGILESIEFDNYEQQQADESKRLSTVVEEKLTFYNIDLSWQTLVEYWMKAVIDCPLNEAGLSLGQLPVQACLIEMEFLLPLADLDMAVINQALYKVTQKHFTPLQQHQIQGMLKGFIDLIFCWQGKYYVLDYKSNYLGESADDYNDDNMEQVMASHHYHLQYLLYTVALHRILKHRVKDYDPKKHLGGSYYLFLRGMIAGKGIYYKETDLDALALLDGLFEQGADNAV